MPPILPTEQLSGIVPLEIEIAAHTDMDMEIDMDTAVHSDFVTVVDSEADFVTR